VEIPLYSILFIYLLYLVVFVIFVMINFYHIVASASFTLASFFVSFLCFALAALTIYFTVQLLMDIDWQQTIISFGATNSDPWSYIDVSEDGF